MADSQTISATAAPHTRPDYRRPEYTHAQDARDLCHALMHGTAGVRALGKRGLPQWPAEKPEHYAIRASISQVARYYARTVGASVGMICATPPALNADADAALLADAEDVDGRGTHFEVFAKHLTSDAITGGFCCILVDAPPIPDGMMLTLADEQALELRPFMVLIESHRVVSWVVETPPWPDLLARWALGQLTSAEVQSYAKQTILRQVVIHEPTDVPAGAYGVECKDRYRSLRLTDAGVTFEVWEKRKGDATAGEHFVLLSSGPMMAAGRTPFREIPIAIVYGGRKQAPFVAEPALLGLAELNLDHYQVSADRRYLMKLCHAPTLFLAGFQEEMDELGRPKPINVGGNSVLMSSDPTAKAAYVAASPNALDSSKEEKEELVRQMAVLGMSFIGKDKRGASETATGRALDAAAENATHATVARGLQDGLEQAWRFMSAYRGVPAPEVTVSTTYASAEVDPQIANVLWLAVAAGQVPVDAFVEYLKTGALPENMEESVKMLAFVTNDSAATEQPAPDAITAAQQLRAAMLLHKQHMNGTAPTTGPAGERSQMQMMQMMQGAYAALTGDASVPPMGVAA